MRHPRTRFIRLCIAGLSAIAMLVGAHGSLAQSPGANGVLTYRHRIPSGYQAGEDGVYGLGPLPASLPASGSTLIFPDFSRASWAPDGNRALLEKRPSSGYASLWLWRVEAAPVQVVGANADRASWSPDGTRFAYAVFSPDNAASAEIWVANADGTNQHPVTHDNCAKLGLAWGRTPQGDKIAFVDACPDWGVYTINPDGSGLQQVPGVSSQLAFHASTLDWSPDGSGKLIFESFTATTCQHGDCRDVQDIFAVNSQTGQLTNLTNTDTWEGPYESRPVWSPDGTKIAYTAYSMSFDGTYVHVGRSAVSVMNADGSNQRVVTEQLPGEDPYSTYEDSVSWQPCVSGLTAACTAAALASPPPPPPPPPPAPPPPSPPPFPPPPPTPASARLTDGQAVRDTHAALSRRFGRAYAHRTRHSEAVRRCNRLTRVRMRCAVEWFFKNYDFYGAVTIWSSRKNGAVSWSYSYIIHRTDDACVHRQRRSPHACTKTYVSH